MKPERIVREVAQPDPELRKELERELDRWTAQVGRQQSGEALLLATLLEVIADRLGDEGFRAAVVDRLGEDVADRDRSSDAIRRPRY